jgi:addiction module HigA family antidote
MAMMNGKKRRPTHPGVILREDILPEMGLNQAQFATLLSVSRSYLNEIINERRPITKGLARRLAHTLGTTPELWLNLQKAVDRWEVSNEDSTDYKFGSFLIFRGPIAPVRSSKASLAKHTHSAYWEVLEKEFRAANLV